MIPLTCKLKLKRLLLYLLQVLRGCKGVSRGNRFLSCENKPQHQSCNRLYYTPVGALRCKRLRVANARETDTPRHLYGTSHMSSVEPVSRKRVRSVGAASSGHCRNAKRVHVGG